MSIMTPLKFNTLKKYHCNPPREALGRSKTVYNNYIKFEKQIKTKYKSFTEYIKNNYFSKSTKYILLKNDFPYYLNDCEHLLLWFNDNVLEKLLKINIKQLDNINIINIESIIRNELFKYYNKNIDNENIIVFENKFSQRTVPGIRHLHIFVKL